MRPSVKKFRLTLLLIAAAVFVLYFLSPLSLALKTALAYTNLIVTEGRWRPLNLLTRAPAKETVSLIVRGRPLQADVYRPRPLLLKPKEYPALAIFTPFVGDVRQDKRLVNLAETLARLGFIVSIPERVGDYSTIISQKDLEDASASWHYLHELPETDDKRMAFFGMSYGLGPVLLLAADETTFEVRPPFVIGFGGYAELKNMIRFALTGSFEYNGIQGQVEPDPWVRGVVKDNFENALPPSSRRDNFLTNSDPEQFDALYDALPGSFKEKVKEFSPSTVLHEIRVPLILIHSTDDPVVPYTESFRLRDLAINAPAVSVSLVSIFEHGTYKPLNWHNLRAFYLPSLSDSFRFLYRVLAVAE